MNNLLKPNHPDLLSNNENVNQAMVELYNLRNRFSDAQLKNDLFEITNQYKLKNNTLNICKKVADACSEENEAIGNCGITAAMETLYNGNNELLKKYQQYQLANGKLCDMDRHCFNKFWMGYKNSNFQKPAKNDRYYNNCYDNNIRKLTNNCQVTNNDIDKLLPSGKRYYCCKGALSSEEKEKLKNEEFEVVKKIAIEKEGIIAEIRYGILAALQSMAKKYNEIIKNCKDLEDISKVLKREIDLLNTYCKIESIDNNVTEKDRTQAKNELLACDKSIYLPALGLGLSYIHQKTIFILDNSEDKSKLWVFDASKINDEKCKHSTISIFETDSKNMPEKKIKLAQHYKDQIDSFDNPILFYDEKSIYGHGHFRYLDPKKTEKRKIFKMHMSNLFLDRYIKQDLEQQENSKKKLTQTITKQANTIKKSKEENNDLKEQIEKLKDEKTKLESQVKSNKEVIEKAEKSISALNINLTNIQKKITEQEWLTNTMQSANSDLENTNKRLERKNKALKSENNSLRQELEGAKKENQTLKSENGSLKQQLSERLKITDEALKSRETMSNELKKVKNEFTKVELKHEKQQTEQKQTIEKLNSEVKTLNEKKQKLLDEQKKQTQCQACYFLKQADFTNFTARKFSLIYFFAWLFQCIPCCEGYINRIRAIRDLNNKFDALRNRLALKNDNDIENAEDKDAPKQADEIFCALDKFLPDCNDVNLFNRYVFIYCNLLDLYQHDTNKIYRELSSNLRIGPSYNLLKEKIDQLNVTDNKLNNGNNIDNENKNIIDTNNFLQKRNEDEPKSGVNIGDEKK